MANNIYAFPNGNLPGLDVNPTLDVFLAGRTGPALIQNAAIQAFAGPNGTQIRFTGVGLQYDPAGNGIAGFLTSVQIVTFDAIGNPVIQEITLPPFPANSFAAFYQALNGPEGALGAVKFLMSGNDTVTGSNSADDIAGHAGNDILLGNGGDDHIVGGAGADFINGGAGFDEADYSDSYGRPLVGTERATQGIFVNAAGNFVIDFQGNFEVVTGVESYTGTQFIDTMLGDGDNETFRGLGNNDFINGGGGIDTAAYDRDVNFGGLAGVTVNLATGQATDGFGNIDTLVNIENATGSQFNDTLIGNAGVNVLRGLGGDDRIDGGGNNFDIMRGGEGNDTYVVTGFLQQVDEAADNGSGIDTVESSISYSLDPNHIGFPFHVRPLGDIENLTLTGGAALAGFGNALANIIEGNAAANEIAGFGGNDTLRGNGGDDEIDGGAGNDALFGGDGDDHLIGGIGNDFLDGGTGVNTLEGGLGNDTYALGDKADGTDAIIETGGNDTITSTIDRSLQFFSSDDATNIENLTLLGTARTGIGSDGNNVITGNAMNNSLSGLGGNDVLIGGEGNDTLNGGGGTNLLDGGNGNDIYFVNTSDSIRDSGGIDTAISVQSINLLGYGDVVENATLTSIGNANITGTNLNNVLIGNVGNNTINGLAGNDQIRGGFGDDRLNGGAGADNIQGGDGNDRISGGTGIDHLFGGADNDTFVYDVAVNVANRDVIHDFTVGEDLYGLARSIFGGVLGATITADELRLGSAALDANDHLIYNKASGNLSFDTNGNVGGGSTLLATFLNKPDLHVSDFALI